MRVKLSKPVVRLAGTENEYKIEYKVECHASDVPDECRKPGQSRGVDEELPKILSIYLNI